MDKFLSNLRSSHTSSDDDKEGNFKEAVSRKIGSLKNYVTSKFRNKYEINRDTAGRLSVISFDQHSFDDVEKKFDLEHTRNGRALSKTLSRMNEDGFRRISKERLEVLEIVERTFNRQLDIFEELLKVRTERKKSDSFVAEHFLNEQRDEEMVDGETVQPKFSRSRQSRVANVAKFEKTFGDSGSQTNRNTSIACECQYPNSSGAAVGYLHE